MVQPVTGDGVRDRVGERAGVGAFTMRERRRMVQVFTDAKVFTGESEADFATAFRVVDGMIDWVGAESDLGADARIAAHSFGGRVVLPGLLDMHLHPSLMARTADAVQCLPPRVSSVAELTEALRSHHAFDDGDDRWITGTGYDETKYPTGRPPTAVDLDEVSTTQPILVWRADRHSAVCNHRALEIAGIDAATPDPPGARFERGANGKPTGILTERDAVSAVADFIPHPTDEERTHLLAKVGRKLFSRGIVGVCDLLATTWPQPLAIYQKAFEIGPFPRSVLFYGWDPEVPLSDLSADERTGSARVGGVKILMDGTYSNRTAWVHQPYPKSADSGLRTVSDEDARCAAAWARRNGMQLAVHAMGDRAIEHVVDLFGDEDPWLEGQPSVRIEHATLMSPDLIERIRTARMTFGIATHTIFLFSEFEAYDRNLRAEQRAHAYPIKSLYHSIESLALSSDCPATAWSDADDVFVSVEAAVRRRAYNGADIGQNSAVTVAQALLLYTARPAQLTVMQGLGKIAPDYDASFVVLDRDVFTIPDTAISNTRVNETWIRGERVF